MGFFDIFKGGGGEKKSGAKKEVSSNNAVSKYGDRAADKRAQNYDRAEALVALAEVGSADAAEALLRRFTFKIDPSITDQEEKEVAAQGILAAGKDAIVPIREFSEKAESLAWPMRILKEIVSEDEFVEEICGWLDRWDTEYSKFVDPKIQLLVELEEHKHAKIRETVEPFLEDVNETARFHAIAALFHQDEEDVAGAILAILPDEESFRVKNKIADGFIAKGWSVPADSQDAIKALPPAYEVADGKIKKR
ncbi:MAG TPA: HEAT repeat domain-containing protein [Polyangiaceae bacterium]